MSISMGRRNPGEDLIGQRFGRMEVIGIRLVKNKWECVCLCDCGDEKGYAKSLLVHGRVKSCGCHAGMTHGMSREFEYGVWSGMKARCYNKRSTSYTYYGGRGISICDRWRNSFEDFYADMGKCDVPNGSIDRIDNNGNYEPGNCRWATPEQQAQNRSAPRKAGSLPVNVRAAGVGRYIGRFTLSGRRHYCGLHESPLAALEAVEQARQGKK